MAVARAVCGLDDHLARIENAAIPIAQNAPKTAAAFRANAVRATRWLAMQIPASMQQPSEGALPQLDKPYVSPQEAEEFTQKFDAVNDPASVLADMKEGRATPAQIEAIRAIYPNLYSEMAQKLRAELAAAKKPPSYEARKQISYLLGQPADPTFSPAFVQAMQAQPSDTRHPQSQSQTQQAQAIDAPPVKGAPKRKLSGFAEAASLPGQPDHSALH